MKNTIVLNLFGAPGAGKSTGAAYIFAMLKLAGVNAELVTEFAKDKVWEEDDVALRDQSYIFGQQSLRISRCNGKVDVIVTDSPLLLSAAYQSPKTEEFGKYVYAEFSQYNNRNYFIVRHKPYNPSGRLQTEAESDGLRDYIRLNLLEKYNVPYTTYTGTFESYNQIVRECLEALTAGGSNEVQ